MPPRPAGCLALISILALSLPLAGQKFRSLEKAKMAPLQVVELKLKRKHLAAVPATVAEFTNLQVLNLSKNEIRQLPAFLSQLPHLRTIILSKNNLTSFPAHLAGAPRLQVLVLDRNPIDSLPAAIAGFTALQELDLWDAELEYISPKIKSLQNLKILDVRNTYFRTAELNWIEEAMPWLDLRSSYGCDCD